VAPHKPGAPATASLTTRPGASGQIEVTLTVTALADLTDVILELHLPPGAAYVGGSLVRPVGALGAGQAATLVATVDVSPSGRGEIGGGARLAANGRHGGVAAAALLGGIEPPRSLRVVDTAHGQVTEVRQ